MERSFVPKRALPVVTVLVFTALAVLLILGGSPVSKQASVKALPQLQNPPVVSFTLSNDSIIEPDAGDTDEIDIFVQINQAPEDSDVMVTYSTANGSATAGVDYQAETGTLTFPVGSTEAQSFAVTINGNNNAQPNRTFIAFLTNATNATVGSPGSTTITIVDDDVAPATNTPTPTPGGPVFLDQYEPNNVFETAYTTAANAAKLADATLWPVGDVDYYQFFGKQGGTYEIFTTDLAAGLDTYLRVYDPNGNLVAENDDFDVANLRSQTQISAKENGNYFAQITNKEPTDSTGKTYSFGVNEVNPPTPTPTATLVGVPDTCEPNNTVGSACLTGPGEVKSAMNFVPPFGRGTGPDNDFYRMAVKPGLLYTCETTNLSSVNDTNMIFLDGNGNDFNPPLGNDDRAPGDLSSRLSWVSTYQGNLIILVGPVSIPTYETSPQFTYDLVCTETAATPTPVPTPTTAFIPPSSSGPGSGVTVPTATPLVFPTFPPSPTPIDFENLAPPTSAPPIVGFRPLPTSTPATGAVQVTSVQVTVYYDSNFNFTPELTEGIMDVAVELYDNDTNRLVAFGYTNEAGVVRFETVSVSRAVRVQVPYLNYSSVVVGASANILLRVEPRPLPGGIP